MSPPVIIDAGPALNFLATHNERILLTVTGGRLAAPVVVDTEVRNKASSDARFEAAARTWSKLITTSRLQVLPNDAAPLRPAADLILRAPLPQRMTAPRDLGETMVVLHAATMAAAGQDVIVLIDDQRGAQMARSAAQVVPTLAGPGAPHGRLLVTNTTEVLIRAAGTRHLPDRAKMRTVYNAMRGCDDGLVHLNQTSLLNATTWNRQLPPA